MFDGWNVLLETWCFFHPHLCRFYQQAEWSIAPSPLEICSEVETPSWNSVCTDAPTFERKRYLVLVYKKERKRTGVMPVLLCSMRVWKEFMRQWWSRSNSFRTAFLWETDQFQCYVCGIVVWLYRVMPTPCVEFAECFLGDKWRLCEEKSSLGILLNIISAMISYT